MKPHAFQNGTSMNFVGLKRDRDQADVIAFLNEVSDSPIDFGVAVAASMAPPEAEDYGVMVAAPEASETFDACATCHSERIVAQQGLMREQWSELLDWVVEEQEMEPMEAGARDIILAYLAEHCGPTARTYRAGELSDWTFAICPIELRV